MVYSSVYRRSYREPSWDDYSKKEFFSKLQYRSDRRSVEHRHQPWKWNGETESDDENVEEIPADDGSYEGGRRWRKRVDRMGRSIPKQAWEEEKKDIQQPVHGKSLPPPEKLTYGEEDENKQKRSHEAKRMNHYNQRMKMILSTPQLIRLSCFQRSRNARRKRPITINNHIMQDQIIEIIDRPRKIIALGQLHQGRNDSQRTNGTKYLFCLTEWLTKHL